MFAIFRPRSLHAITCNASTLHHSLIRISKRRSRTVSVQLSTVCDADHWAELNPLRMWSSSRCEWKLSIIVFGDVFSRTQYSYSCMSSEPALDINVGIFRGCNYLSRSPFEVRDWAMDALVNIMFTAKRSPQGEMPALSDPVVKEQYKEVNETLKKEWKAIFIFVKC